MGLFVLLAALFETISETAKENIEHQQALNEKRRYEDIDFYKIESVSLDCTEPAYRIETKEEFDVVMSDFLTRQDGWQHHETKTVEYEVEDGENYCFTIRYNDGTEIYRKFHEDSPLTERLLKYCENEISKEKEEIVEDFCNVINQIGNTFNSQLEYNDYETALYNFKQMQNLYGLNENSSQTDFENATEIKMTSLIMSNNDEFNKSIYELMLFLLGTKDEEDVLEKTDNKFFSFLQLTENGVDAFAILPKGEDVDDNLIARYNDIRYKNGFRKAVILTTGTDKSTSENSNIVVWDLKKICLAYINAFKKVVLEEIDTQENEEKRHFAIIDFETTGLNYDHRQNDMDEIISVAIIDQDGEVLLNTYCDTINKKTWTAAQRIHGISPADVNGYPTFVKILPKVIKILRDYDYVLAYNIHFERLFIENYVSKYLPKDLASNIRWGEDPMFMFKEHLGVSRYQKLEKAAKHFGYSFNSHNALEDAKATLYVYNALLDLDNKFPDKTIYSSDYYKVPLMCPNCKTKIPQESIYCSNCGIKL